MKSEPSTGPRPAHHSGHHASPHLTPGDDDEHLIGRISRAHDFRTHSRTATLPAGTEVLVRTEAFEDDNCCVRAYIPGTRLSAVLTKAMITPV